MIYLCPYCGRNLDYKLGDGITTCHNCGRVFDSSPFHKLLAAGWAVRRWHLYDLEELSTKCNLNPSEAQIIGHYVMHLGYPHDDFHNLLTQSNVASKSGIG
jgi:hypothetical protein